MSLSNARRGGVWTGYSTNNAGWPDEQLVGASTQNGEFLLVSLPYEAHYLGTLNILGNLLYGSATSVAPIGTTFLNGKWVVQTEFIGILDEQNSIEGDWESTETSEAGKLSLTYWDIHQRPSTSSNFNGRWISYEETNTSLETDLQFSNGNFSGNDIFGCLYSGSVSPDDPTYNVYRVNVTVTNCVLEGTNYNGSYNGLGVLIDALFTDNTSITNGRFIFGVNNGVHYIADELYIVQ